MKFTDEIEKNTGIKVNENFLPVQAGDVAETSADINDLTNKLHFQPVTSVGPGVKNFVNWFNNYYTSIYQNQTKIIQSVDSLS